VVFISMRRLDDLMKNNTCEIQSVEFSQNLRTRLDAWEVENLILEFISYIESLHA
jgi:hypothetical protein